MVQFYTKNVSTIIAKHLTCLAVGTVAVSFSDASLGVRFGCDTFSHFAGGKGLYDVRFAEHTFDADVGSPVLFDSLLMMLGTPVPEGYHSISVSLPHWEHVVGYEEGQPPVVNAMTIGYPRFRFHNDVTTLNYVLRSLWYFMRRFHHDDLKPVVIDEPNSVPVGDHIPLSAVEVACMVVPNKWTGLRLAQYLSEVFLYFKSLMRVFHIVLTKTGYWQCLRLHDRDSSAGCGVLSISLKFQGETSLPLLKN